MMSTKSETTETYSGPPSLPNAKHSHSESSHYSAHCNTPTFVTYQPLATTDNYLISPWTLNTKGIIRHSTRDMNESRLHFCPSPQHTPISHITQHTSRQGHIYPTFPRS